MKRLLKMYAMFAVICMVFALGACSHSSSSGSDSDGGGNGDNSGNDNNPPSLSEVELYIGTWEPSSWENSSNWSEYIVIQEDGTYYLWYVDGSKSGNEQHKDSQKGTWVENEDGSLTLKASYYYDTDNGTFTSIDPDYGLYMTINDEGYATVSSWYGGGETEKGTYKKTSSNTTPDTDEDDTVDSVEDYVAAASISSLTSEGTHTIKVSSGTNSFEAIKEALLSLESGIYVDLDLSETGATSIGEKAFNGCTSLVSVTLPDSLKTIGDSAFNRCSSLVSITIPSKVTSIGDLAFYSCTSLKSVFISDSVISIGKQAFDACTSLESINLPSNLSSMGSYAFRKCPIDSVTIPSSLKEIPAYAFSETALKSIEIPSTMTEIGNYSFSHCLSLTSAVLAAQTIGPNAFYDCTSLESVTIKSSVKSIKTSSFINCSSLTSATFEVTGGWTVGSNEISESDLQDETTAATLLTETYIYNYSDSWTCSGN